MYHVSCSLLCYLQKEEELRAEKGKSAVPLCSIASCRKPTWNGRPGSYCAFTCRRLHEATGELKKAMQENHLVNLHRAIDKYQNNAKHFDLEGDLFQMAKSMRDEPLIVLTVDLELREENMIAFKDFIDMGGNMVQLDDEIVNADTSLSVLFHKLAAQLNKPVWGLALMLQSGCVVNGVDISVESWGKVRDLLEHA
jgi:hypothetical protein